jgi:hypothetical protein
MAVTFLDGISISGAATINLDSGDAFTINEPDKDQPGRLIFDYSNGDPTLTIASRASTAKIVVRADTSSTKLTLDEDGQIYVNGNNYDGVKIEGTNFHSVGTNANKLDLGSSTRPWGDIYSTGSYVNTLTLSSIAAAGEETVSALFEESGAVVKANLGTNAFTSTTIPTNNNQLTNGAGYITSLSGAVLTSGNQSIAGVKTFTEEEGGIVANYASTDGSAGITTTVGVKNASQSQNLTLTIKDGIVTAVSSDRRLKTNITLIGTSDSGINIYTFEYKYKFSIEGVGLFQGVMSDEVPENAVSVDHHGFDVVDYSLIDVEFKRVSI